MAQQLTEASLRDWMVKLGPRLIALSKGICRDHHRAEEIVQEAFVKLWRNPPDAGEIAYTSWMRRVVTNLSINALQRQKKPQTLPEFSADPAMQSRSNDPGPSEASEDLSQVAAAMERIDPAKRAILILRAHEQLSYEQIAQHLDIPVGTVMSRLNRARAALIEQMQHDAEHAANEADVFDFQKYKFG